MMHSYPMHTMHRAHRYNGALSPSELAALRAYAQHHGRAWKAALRRDWMYATAPAELMRLRNRLGPGWLTSYRLPAASTRSNAYGHSYKHSSRHNGRLPQYSFLVVEKLTGRVHAGADTRNDAEDMRHDLPTPASALQVLTREGVRRKFGRIAWTSVASMRNGYGKPRRKMARR